MDDKTKLVIIRCARVYISTKNWKKAIFEYENLRKDFPDDPFVLEPLAKAYYEDGQKEKSKELYETVQILYQKKENSVKVERLQKDIDKLFGQGQEQEGKAETES